MLGCLAARTSGKFSRQCCTSGLTCILLAYFVITEPTRTSQWVAGMPHPVTWSKGANDGIVMVDVELSRLSQDGLIFVARNGRTYFLSVALFANLTFISSRKTRFTEYSITRCSTRRRLLLDIHKFHSWGATCYLTTLHHPPRFLIPKYYTAITNLQCSDGDGERQFKPNAAVCDDVCRHREW
jgi:hypothetical protein